MEYSLSPPRHRYSSSNHNNTNSINTASNPAQPSTQPWTATRCHRLLRPLLTHISALRKDKAWKAIAAQEEANNSKRKRDESDTAAYRPGKRPCRKYSSKASRSAAYEELETPKKPSQTRRRRVCCAKPASSRQEVILPTPFLRRVKNNALSSSPNRGTVDDNTSEEEPRVTATSNTRCSHQQTCVKGRCVYEVELASLKTSTDPQRHGLFKSIFHAFDALLRSTSASKYPSPAAPKSLLAMCLHKVPEYVAELEYWDQKDAEERGTKSDKQVSFEVYTELEGLNPVSDGWRHLCAVVRAHGVRIIREGILEDQLFDDSFTDLLIRLSLEYLPLMECSALIDSYIQRPYPKPVAAEDSLFTANGALRPLRLLKVCDTQTTAEAAFSATKLVELLLMDLLPAKWILTKEFKALWVSTAGLIVKKHYRQNVVNFLITTLTNMCTLVSNSERLAGRMKEDEQPWQKAQNTLVGSIAALTSIMLLLQDGVSAPDRIEMVGSRVKFILDSCVRDLEPGHIGAYLLSLCAYLIFKTEKALSQLRKAWARLQKSRGKEEWTRQIDATAVFVSSVAYYCSRGDRSSPTESLAHLCDELETLQLPGDPFNNLQVEAAFSLAEQTGDLRDLAFAEDLKAKTNTAAGQHNTSNSKQTGSSHDETSLAGGFRWDEGISEWVNISPVPVPPKQQSMRAPRSCNRRADTAPPHRIRQTRNKAPNYQAEYESDDSEEIFDSDNEAETSDEEIPDSHASSEGEDISDEEDATKNNGEREEIEEDEDETLVNEFTGPQEPTPGPEEDEDEDLEEDEMEDEGSDIIIPPAGGGDELEIPSPTLVNLFSSNRLRRPMRKSTTKPPSQQQQRQLPSSPPLSRLGYSESPKRRSIWGLSTSTNGPHDDELCLDSPSPTRAQKHKENIHSHRRSSHGLSSRSTTDITGMSKVRKVGSSSTSLLSLQPKRSKSVSSNIAVVLKSSTSSNRSVGSGIGRKNGGVLSEKPKTSGNQPVGNESCHRARFWDLAGSSDDELSFF